MASLLLCYYSCSILTKNSELRKNKVAKKGWDDSMSAIRSHFSIKSPNIEVPREDEPSVSHKLKLNNGKTFDVLEK